MKLNPPGNRLPYLMEELQDLVLPLPAIPTYHHAREKERRVLLPPLRTLERNLYHALQDLRALVEEAALLEDSLRKKFRVGMLQESLTKQALNLVTTAL